jgi:hypothetical protein
MSKHYLIYGIRLRSNLAIPGPTPLDDVNVTVPQVDVKLGFLPEYLASSLQETKAKPVYYCDDELNDRNLPNLEVWKIEPEGYFYFRYSDDTKFVIDCHGTQVWATWTPDLTLEDTVTYFLGPVLGFVLRLRGVTCLHASCVSIEGRAVAFLGASGAGKSTTIAAFAQRGYSILGDDVVALIDRGQSFDVQPTYPHIRLWESSVVALYQQPDALPRIVPTHPIWDKRYLDLTQPGYQFQQEPLPLAAIYYLNPRSEDPTCPRIEPMPAQEQLITLVTNTYTNYLLDKQQRAHEFEVLSRLVKHVPIRKITPHTDVAQLPQLLYTILEDFQVLAPVVIPS